MPRRTTVRNTLREEMEFVQDVLGEARIGQASDEAIAELIIPRLLDYEAPISDRELCGLVQRTFGIEFDLNDLVRVQRSAAFQERWPLSDYGTEPRVSLVRHAFTELLGKAIELAPKSARRPACAFRCETVRD